MSCQRMRRSSRCIALVCLSVLLFLLLAVNIFQTVDKEELPRQFSDPFSRINLSRAVADVGKSGYSLPSDRAGSWKKSTFCHSFIAASLQQSTPAVCINPYGSIQKPSVSCFTGAHSSSMVACSLENVVVHPKMLAAALQRPEHVAFSKPSMSIALLDDLPTTCSNMTLNGLLARLKSDNYMVKIIEELKYAKTYSSNICRRWIKEEVLFFTSKQSQIYFRFLDYYNLHKLLEDIGNKHSSSSSSSRINSAKGNYHIVRVSGSSHYYFPEFDQLLFPEADVITINDFKNVSICYKKVTLVPRSYSSPIFQCKLSNDLLKLCLSCNGLVRRNTPINTFRQRVLRACNLKDNRVSSKISGFNITIISRNPYSRFPKDKANSFQRVLANEGTLVLRLKAKFSFANVRKVLLEDLGICEQVRLVQMSDVLVGVHGAGLVHLWWLRDEALVYELEPHFEVSNPTFRVLARLSGRRYMRSLAGGDTRLVYARVNQVLRDIEMYFKTRMQ